MGNSEVHFVELLRCLRSIKKWPAQGDPCQISGSMNVSLFGKRVIAGVIKLWILRLSWFTWVGSNFNKCLFQSKAEAHLWQKKRQIQGRRWCEDRAEGGVATSQGMPTTPEAGTSNERFFSRSFRGRMALLTPWSQIFYPMELWKNTLLLFEADKFVVICYCSQWS